MKNTILLLGLCSLFFNAQAQFGSNYNDPKNPLVNTNTNLSSILLKDNEPDLPVIGNRYFYDSTFHKGELRTPQKRFKDEYTYRFDMVERTIEAKSADGTSVLVDEKDIVWCKLFIKNQVIAFVSAKVPNDQERSILQVVYQSETLQLLRDFNTIATKKQVNTSTTYPDYALQIESKSRYFVNQGGNKPFSEVQLTAKSFSLVFPKQEQFIEQLFKKYKKDKMVKKDLVLLLRKLDNRLVAQVPIKEFSSEK